MLSPGVQQAGIVIAVVAVIAGLYFAKAALVPVLFAVVFALLLSSSVDWLQRRRVPRAVASALVVASLVAIIAACANAIWDPAREWLDAAPRTMRTLEQKLRPVTRFIAKVESVSDQAGRMAEPAAAPKAVAPAPAREDAKSLVASTQEWILAAVTTLFLTYFLLADGPAMLERIGRGTAATSARGTVLRLADAIRNDVGRYFGTVTLSNAILGIATTLAMYWLDMPNPLLWGAIAFTLNFIPYAGSAVTLVLLTVVALVSFEGAGRAVAVAGSYLVLTTLEGQLLQPVLVGRRLDLSPVAVILGLWFGGWLWGVAGVALAMPVMVAAKTAFNTYRAAPPDAGHVVPTAVVDRDLAPDRAASPRWRLRRPLQRRP
jgi:predicted PurR-regulated permease PerM